MPELVPPVSEHGGVQADSEPVAAVVRLPLDVRSLSLSPSRSAATRLGQMQAVVTQLPEATSKFAAGLSRLRTSQLGPLLKMQSVSTAVEKATSQLTNPSPVAGQR